MYEKLITIACLTGFFSDAALQIFTKFLEGPTLSLGLKPYFKQHGSLESMFISGGMTAVFYIIYIYLFKLPIVWYYIALYGILIDFLFRKLSLYKALYGYYKSVNYFWSAVFASISMVLPLLISRNLYLLRI
jgi:hypothetical protein